MSNTDPRTVDWNEPTRLTLRCVGGPRDGYETTIACHELRIPARTFASEWWRDEMSPPLVTAYIYHRESASIYRFVREEVIDGPWLPNPRTR